MKPLQWEVPNFGPRQVICSYNDYQTAINRYPNRLVSADVNCPSGELYYMTSRGTFRMLKLAEGTIWESIYEGIVPSIFRGRIR